MYHNILSFVIISGSSETEDILRRAEPLEDCSYCFKTVSSAEAAETERGKDTAYIFDCTEMPLPKRSADKWESCAVILPAGSPALSDAETLSSYGDIWLMPEGKYSSGLISAYFTRLAARMKFAADSRKQEICFSTLINSVPDISWYKDTNGSHLIVNDSFCAMVGKSKEQIYKKGHCYIWDATPEDEEVCLSSDREIMASRRTNTFEENVITNSETLLLSSYKSPLIDVDGEVFGTCGIARDVTEFKNATTEIQILIDSFPYVVLLESADHTVMSKNLHFDRYFPEFTDIIGKSSNEWRESLNIITMSGSKQREVTVTNGGEERTLFIEEEPLLDIFYHEKGKIITLADITDERNILKELEESKQRAQEANRAKSLFLANMSHEIRTPINSVIGMNEMILRESREQDIRSYALNARRSAKMLLGLINDILDFSKIESGRMELSCAEYSTAEIFSDVANMVLSRANDKGLSMTLDVDPATPSVLYGDDVRIRQIITNLLTNAVKYTKEGGIKISVSSDIQGEYVDMLVRVTDTGIGIKSSDIDHLFDAFRRMDKKETRTIEGTGLGLNITNRLLTLMGAKLEVKSEYGKGSEFYFRLRQRIVDGSPVGLIEINAESEDNFTYSAAFTAPAASILVVDDNDMNRVVFRSLLKQTKVRVTEAASGPECLSLIEKERFDIIFLDHMMPGMDGIETFEQIKTRDNLCKDVPVVALTANVLSGAKEFYLAKGFTSFLPKPISFSQLEKMTMSLLPRELVREGAVTEDEAQAPALPEITGFNFDIARLYAKNDDIIRLSLGAFGDNLIKASALLKYYLPLVCDNSEYLDAFRIQAHALKSAAAMVGSMQVSEMAKTAEFAARDSDTERIKAITPILLDEAGKCLSVLEEAGVYKKKPENPDLSKLADTAKQILSLTEEFMIDEADELMNGIYGFSYPDDMQARIELLKIAVANCDCDSMGSVIADIESIIGI